MESNINHSAIEQYGTKFTESICDQFFAGKIHIKADEIIHLTPVQQVNYFVLKELFQRWKSEIHRLKSPYFDYENDEVQASLKDFMNVLSQNILIKREDLEPLLKVAIRNAIIMIFSPYEFFLQEINNPEFKQVSIQDLKDLQRYIKVNEHLLSTYLKKFEDEGIEAVFNDDAVRMFNEVVESTGETPEEFDMFLKQFSEVLPLTDEIVFSPTVPEVGSAPIQEDGHTGEVESEVEPVDEPSKEEFRQTIHDSLHVEQHETLADIHRKQPSESIKKSITLNQRFMFVNDLFKGSMDDFEMAVGILENCTNFDEAIDFIKTNYFDKNIWDSEKEEVQEFLEVVQRRFPQ